MNLYGVYRGTVTANGDPQGRGRVQVSVPEAGIDSIWAPGCLPAGGHTASIHMGSTVIVSFETGDPAYPIVLGRLP
jgi:uncharacterized protein involved in type VI secretion and phage assembly